MTEIADIQAQIKKLEIEHKRLVAERQGIEKEALEYVETCLETLKTTEMSCPDKFGIIAICGMVLAAIHLMDDEGLRRCVRLCHN